MMEKREINTVEINELRLADTTVGKLYYSIVELQLGVEKALIYKNGASPEMAGQMVSWPWLLEQYKDRIYPADREKLVQSLSLDSLNQMVEMGGKESRIELRVQRDNRMPNWVEIETSVISHEEKKLLITARNIEEQRLLEHIVRLYVYNNCDYFICLDAKNNQYKMLWEQALDKAVPAAHSEDYTGEFFRYIDTYVVPEDQEAMKREILPEYILSSLDQADEHTVYYGLLDPERGYTRKRLQFLYYDRATQMVLLIRTDVTDFYLDAERKNDALKQALFQAQTDPLTGVYNHAAIEKLIRKELAGRGCVRGAMLFIDLDDFKHVNDVQGHREGDDLLRFVAQSIRGSLRAKDLVGRIGGDEFIVFLQDFTDKGEAEQCADRLHRVVSQFSDNKVPVTCSIGIAQYPEDGEDYDTLFCHADRAMYLAKAEGKARYASWVAENPYPAD